MGVIHIDNIKPGMVLDDDIRDHHGRFLLGKDLAIESKHLRILKIWGINQADIKNDDLKDSNGDEQFDMETINQAQEIVYNRIYWSNKTITINKNLLEIFINSVCQKLNKGQKNFGFSTDEQPIMVPNKKDLINTESKLKDDAELISVPRIFFLIREAIKDPRTSAKHIADIISKDQALAAKLLRLVNSAFYGFPSKIDTISRAVTIIGTRQLSSLALGLSTLSRFKNISPEVMDMESFWKHSISCAIGAKTLAGYRKLPNTESFFICGLLHDLGKLIMLNYYPREYLNSLLWANKNKFSLTRAEKDFFVHDHATLGAKL
ncbi:MAG: HDOD domain-containing protein, partial [Desulfonatronovibrio sp.]